jgi:hypothetical protein
VQAGRFDVEIPQQGLARAGQEGGDVGGEDAAADAALVAVEGDDEGCHAASLLRRVWLPVQAPACWPAGVRLRRFSPFASAVDEAVGFHQAEELGQAAGADAMSRPCSLRSARVGWCPCRSGRGWPGRGRGRGFVPAGGRNGVPAGFEHVVERLPAVLAGGGKCCRLALRWRT